MAGASTSASAEVAPQAQGKAAAPADVHPAYAGKPGGGGGRARILRGVIGQAVVVWLSSHYTISRSDLSAQYLLSVY